MVFYEAPHKLPKMLADVYASLGDRRIAIIKELTKIYESVERTTLAEAVEKYKDAKLKGEFVIIIEAAEETESEKTLEDAVDEARDLMDNEEVSANEAAKRIAKITGFKKGDIYRELQN
jgi:16S rRNA (cytidine1402-2'-O)-methyltransferase